MFKAGIFIAVYIIVGLQIDACCQTTLPANRLYISTFVGSTPCDSLIKSIVQIPSNAICDFIKWELSLQERNSRTFTMTIVYGKSKPNTNGFVDGGTAIQVKGVFTVKNKISSALGNTAYYLMGGNLRLPIVLIKMDQNILHFADDKLRLLVGNAGFGYVLNRIKD